MKKKKSLIDKLDYDSKIEQSFQQTLLIKDVRKTA